MKVQKLIHAAIVVLLLPLTSCQNQPNSPLVAQTPSPGEKLDLVFISDSSGWGVAERYAAYIEEDLEVSVTAHDESKGGLSAGLVIYMLDHPNSYELSTLITEAEVIVFLANPLASTSETHPGDWNCVEEIPAMYVTDCSLETFDQYRADLDTIYTRFFELRDGAPTIVRAFDSYVPIYTTWHEQGVYSECFDCWANYTQVLHEAAADHNVLVAHVLDAFNGLDHQETPLDKGYIGSDNIHTSNAGRDVIAGLLRDLGYAYTIPPES